MGGRSNARWGGGYDEVLRVWGSSVRGDYTSIINIRASLYTDWHVVT